MGQRRWGGMDRWRNREQVEGRVRMGCRTGTGTGTGEERVWVGRSLWEQSTWSKPMPLERWKRCRWSKTIPMMMMTLVWLLPKEE